MARYALIIGIAEYTGSFNSLETPVQNANAIADILDQYGDFNQVRRLPFRREAGQQDLGSVIRKPLPSETLVRELQQFLQDAEGSDVLIYYSGHGFTKLDPLSQTPEGYLASSDCQIEVNAAGRITAEKNGISLFGLNALINQHTFSSLVVILDCCNSGAFLESSMVRRDVTAFDYQRDYYLITACRSSSKAYEGEEYSLLTAAVLKGLSAENASPGSGRISGDRLFDVIGNELRNSRQEPIRLGWGRLITLVRYLQAPESAESVVHPFNAANPYMGLKPFEREQAAYFFGREQAVRALLDRLAVNRFLSVIGPSGCGKSSLVKAGLLAELESDRIPGSSEWRVEIIIPGQYPLQSLTNALERHHSDDKPLMLFVDQFEELFTICLNEEEQRTFIKQLNEETNDPVKQTRIIIAMRGDFLDRCAKFQESADLINSTAPTTYMVIPLTEAKLVGELEESITSPAALQGVSFEQGLVSRILDDVINQPGAMPLLQYALMQLWASCISIDGRSRLLTIQSYEAIEGVKGALQRWADQFYTSLSPTDQTFVRELISELVQIGDGGEVTRRRAAWERLRAIASSQEQLDRIIGRLVYQRLLVADDKTVEVAHEALLSESKLIQGWIEENRENIRLQQRLETYCREWQEHDRSENYLLDAGRLAAIDEWMERKQPHLMSVDQEFIEKSRERRDRQFQAQLEQERRLREEAEGRAIAEIEKTIEAEARSEAEFGRAKESIARAKVEKQKARLATGLGGLLFITSIVAGTSALQAQAERHRAEDNEVKSLTALSEARLQTKDQIGALIAGVKALKSLKEKNRQVPDVLIQLIKSVHERNRLEGHTKGIIDVKFSPDGNRIASASTDRTVRIWGKDGKLISELKGHPVGVWGVDFSPDGETIVSGSADGIVRLWNTQGKLKKELRPDNLTQNSAILAVQFSSDGELLAAGDYDKILRVWKIKTGKFTSFVGHMGPIYGVSFSPDRTIIATGSWDGTVKIWSLSSGKLIHDFKAHKGQVYRVSFSPDGKLIASAGQDGIVKIWSAKDGHLIKELKKHKDEVYGISFRKPSDTLVASSNTLIASVSKDKLIYVWDIGKDNPILSLEGHIDTVNAIDFSPDGNYLVSGSDDRTSRIWSLTATTIENTKIDTLINYSCNWLQNFLRSSVTLNQEDREVCKN